MLAKELKELKKVKPTNLLMLTLAGMINAFGVTIFIAPVNLYDSGVSGTSILLSQLTPDYLSLSVFLLVLNIPLFLYGLKKEGLLFTVYAIYTVAVYAFVAWLITDVLPVDVSMASPLAGSDLLLCALFGGLLSGMGSGLASFVMIYNLALYIVAGVVLNSWILPLYSIVAYAAASKTVDYIVEGLDRAKSAMIVTSRPKEICAALSEAFQCGLTVIQAKGYYSNQDKTVVYIIVNRFQVGKMKNIVREQDPKAYVSISEVSDVMKTL